MRFTAEISCFETAYDAENGKQRLLQRHFEADEACETVVVTVKGNFFESHKSLTKSLLTRKFVKAGQYSTERMFYAITQPFKTKAEFSKIVSLFVYFWLKCATSC